ncbi:hypothetical protein HGA11_07515 [Mycolicibacterium septicum DSM 44393]|uniref:Uncharacterized protein n=1 Tax=Mycolicibacterium septicum DSM 44393 TaxID=1341646 RepID=A0A7X6RUY3_9MYCO|nr:hypothetical protein [Mycolicibacterium septicum]NKZ10824.1 hypothetical protein [Mycolicibacterium septicum DSM 44393]
MLLDAEMAIDDAVEATFSSTISMFEFDIVIWNPLRSIATYNTMEEYAFRARSFEGRRWLSSHDSAEIKRDVARRKSEIVDFLQLGRTLVVFLPGDLTVAVETGEKRYSGTGRNQKTTNILEDFDILAALPVLLETQFATGIDMQPVDSSIGPLYRDTVDYWQYGRVIDADPPFHPLLRVAGTTKVVAAEVKFDAGSIIFLPLLWTDDDGQPDAPDDDDGHNAEAETKEPSPGAVVDNLVVKWLIERTTTEDIAWPEWTDHYRFQTELDRAPAVEALAVQAAEIQAQLDGLNAEADADRKWKLLITGTGTPFELAVADALQILGFQLLPVIPGRTDIRGSHNDVPIVVETKGVTKSAAEAHCAQLEKWVAEEVEAGRKPKGILVINAWLKDPPLARTSAAFPPQMRPYAAMRNHCLVSGLQLLNIARTAVREPDRREELATVLLSTIGVVEGWDDPAQIFNEMPEPPTKKRTTRRKKNNNNNE